MKAFWRTEPVDYLFENVVERLAFKAFRKCWIEEQDDFTVSNIIRLDTMMAVSIDRM